MGTKKTKQPDLSRIEIEFLYSACSYMYYYVQNPGDREHFKKLMNKLAPYVVR